MVEAAELNRRLLLLQIETLEDELLPCEEHLADCLNAVRQGREIPDRQLLKKAGENFARLRRLQLELHSTEQLLIVAARAN